jgi:hypothetical protein
VLVASAVGCAGQKQRKYDGWFPPGSTRQQMIAQHGAPGWTATRPSAHPSDAEWIAAVGANKRWMHPSVFVSMIKEVEQRTHTDVARLDTFVVPGHRSFLQRLDVFSPWDDVVYYDASERVIASEALPYYANGD